jgi:hypothetical protein
LPSAIDPGLSVPVLMRQLAALGTSGVSRVLR